MSTSLFSQTPVVTVLDNRSLPVRNIAYHRHPGSLDVTSERITRHWYDALGFLFRSNRPASASGRAGELQLPDGPGWQRSVYAGRG